MERRRDTKEQSRREGHPIRWAAPLYLLVTCCLFWPVFRGHGIAANDALFEHLPWKAHAPKGFAGPGNRLLVDQLHVFYPGYAFACSRYRAGRVPLWTPHLACGQPFMASWQTAVFYPLNLPGAWLGPLAGQTFAVMAKVFLGGLFAYLLARTLGLGGIGAFTAGLVYMLSSYTIVWLGHPHTNASLLLPLVFLCIEQCVATRRAIWCVMLALVVAAQFCGGHPPTSVHMALAAGAFAVYRLCRRAVRHRGAAALLLSAGVVAGTALAACQIAPFIEYYVHSSLPDVASGQHLPAGAPRLGRKAELVLPFRALVTLLVPDFYGRPDERVEWMDNGRNGLNFNERTAFIGVIGLFLALGGLAWRSRGDPPGAAHSLPIFFTAMAAVGLAAAYKCPAVWHLFNALPMVNQTFPTRLSLYFCFGGAILAGMGCEVLLGGRDKLRWKRACIEMGVVVGVAAGAGVVGLLRAPSLQGQELLLPYVGGKVVAAAATLGFLVLWLWAWRSGRVRARLLQISLVMGLAAELLFFAMGYNPSVAPRQSYPTTESIRYLQQHAGRARLLAVDPAPTPSMQRSLHPHVSPRLLPPNAAQVYRLLDARGVDFATVSNYERLVTGGSGNFFLWRAPSPTLPRGFDLLGVKYLLVPRDEPHLIPPELRRHVALDSEDDGVTIWEVDSSVGLPRAYTVPYRGDPSSGKLDGAMLLPSSVGGYAAASIMVDEPTRMVIAPRGRGMLAVSDVYFPGWRAYVDGARSRIHLVNEAFRGVRVRKPSGRVEMVYRPLSFLAGLALSLAAACGLATVMSCTAVRAWLRERVS